MWLVKKFKKLVTLKASATSEEDVIRHYLRSWNPKLKKDDDWNLYMINPWTPLICAHLDTVRGQADHNEANEKWIINIWWVITVDGDAVLWADDRAWVAIAMQLYEDLWDNISILFCSREEIGRVGSQAFVRNHQDLLEQCQYCIIPDRANDWDIISSQNKYCSKEFEDEIAELMKPFWYKPARWVLCDADSFSGIINSVNLSVWYYWQHTKDEFIILDEFVNAYSAILYVMSTYKDKLDPYVEPTKVYEPYRDRYWMVDYNALWKMQAKAAKKNQHERNNRWFDLWDDWYPDDYYEDENEIRRAMAEDAPDSDQVEVEWNMLYVYSQIRLEDSFTWRTYTINPWDYFIW